MTSPFREREISRQTLRDEGRDRITASVPGVTVRIRVTGRSEAQSARIGLIVIRPEDRPATSKNRSDPLPGSSRIDLVDTTSTNGLFRPLRADEANGLAPGNDEADIEAPALGGPVVLIRPED
jgi:hypothetical protein